MSEFKKIEGTGIPQAVGPYSQAIASGNLLFISGQIPIDPTTGKLVAAEIRMQTNRVLDNLAAILKAAGCTFKDVVRAEVFLKDLNDFGVLNEEYTKRFTQAVPPVRQTIQVARLPLDALVEISCIAVINK